MAHTNLLGTAGKYRKQVGMVDSHGKTFGVMEVDAQAVFRLVQVKASKRLGSDQLESDNSHEHALKLINAKCKHEQDIIHQEHKYREGYVDLIQLHA